MVVKKGLALATLILSIGVCVLFAAQNASAGLSSSRLATCKSDANAFDKTGAVARRCDEIGANTGDYRYGALYFVGPGTLNDDQYFIETNGLDVGNREVKMLGTYYVVEANGSTWHAGDISVTSDVSGLIVSVSSDRLKRSGNPGHYKWASPSSDYIIVTVNEKKLYDNGIAYTDAPISGLYGVMAHMYRCAYGNDAFTKKYGCTTEHSPIYFARVSDFGHNTPSITYGGTTYTNGQTIYVQDEKVTLKFDHFITRSDGWGGTKNYSNVYGLNGASKTKNLNSVTTTDAKKVTDKQEDVTATTTGNQVCSSLKHYTRKGIDGYDKSRGESESKICVTVKLNVLIAHSESTVQMDDGVTKGTVSSTDDPNSKTVSIYGGSRKATYEVDFSHKVKVAGETDKSAQFSYSIYSGTSANGSWGSAITTGSPIIAGGGTAKAVYTNGGNLNAVSITVAEGASGTACEKIHFSPRKVVLNSSGTGGTPSGSGDSIICGTVTRRAPDTIYLTAQSNAYHCSDPGNINPSGTYYSTSETQCVGFIHKFISAQAQNLSANYTIYYSEDGGNTVKSTTTGSVTTDKVSGTTHYKNVVKEHTVSLDYGELKTVCEYVSFTPNTFKLHKKADGSADGVEAVGGTDKTNWRCIKVGRPTRETIDDGVFTVYGESTGALDDPSETGGYYAPKDAYLMKKEEAFITYSHYLKRNDDRHEHDSTKPAEDITASYRFAVNTSSFSVDYMRTTSGLGSTVVKNNKKAGPFNSVRNNSLFNDNTTAKAEKVGERMSYCQSIFYYSNQYLMHGMYWMVDGHIWEDNPGMISSDPPTPYPESTNGSVGKSDQGCVNVIRPWNFKVKKLGADESSPTNPIQTIGEPYWTYFKMNIGKNKNDYLLTDMANATVRFVGFKITTTTGTLSGNMSTASDPCTYYHNMLGVSCEVLKEDTGQKFGKNSPANGTTYYTNNTVCNASDCSYNAQLKVEHTLGEDVQLNEKYCIAVGVKSADSGDGFNFSNNWAVSSPSCVNVGKYPNVQIWGGSVFSSGGIQTSLAKYHGKYYGSWGDFALIANSAIVNTASGASLISGSATSNTCTLSSITISNDNCNGNNASRHALGDANITAFSVDVFKRRLYNRYLYDPENYHEVTEISNSTLTSGKNPFIAYNPNGDIFISSNVEFGGSTYAKENVPQTIIYAKGNVYIADQVTHIMAWIIADGVVNTCADVHGHTPELTHATCDLQLRIDGPVIASKVLLNRTYGANGHEGTSAVPAEIIDLNSSAYLFSHYQASGDQPVTTHLQKMPARY